MTTIEIRYTCGTCTVENAKVMVPERGADEDVFHWVKQTVGHAVSKDHKRRSPFCRACVMKELKIPTPPGTEKIGEIVRS